MTEKRSVDASVTLIAATTVVEGKVQTEGSIRIDGRLVGDVVAKSGAAIGLSGNVEGTISARNVTLAGKLKGSVTAAEKLVLEVDGDLLVIPVRSIKYIQVSPAPAHLPAGVFRQAKLVD